MATGRDAALKKAKKLLRQGKLNGAIEEYVRLVEDRPEDWNSINVLGDLYLRAGDGDSAAVQFIRVANHLFGDGSFPRAVALYKKALKAKGDHEHTLRQLAEIAARQGLLADAKAYQRLLAELRQFRGDDRGAAESVVGIEPPEKADADSQIAAAKAAHDAGDTRRAAALLRSAADDFERQGRRSEALDLLLSLARTELASLEEHHAWVTLTRVLTIEPGRRGDVVTIAIDLAGNGRLDSALGCMDVVTDAALLEGGWEGAVDGLETFVRAVPCVPALIKLVELCVDAGLDAALLRAQGQLADAYLEEGKGAEARIISEDLIDHDPDDRDHARRLLRALELAGVADAARLVEERRSGRAVGVDLSDEPEGGASEPMVEASSRIEAPPGIQELVEIDLSDVLADMGSSAKAAEDTAALESAAADPRLRFRAASELGRLHIGRGELRAGIDWLERAAEVSPTTPEEGFAVMYELADALDRIGETTRAMALLIELDADSGGCRDVRSRIEQLARAQTGSHDG